MARFCNLHSTGSTAFGRSILAFAVAPLLSCILVVFGVMLYMAWDIPDGRTSFTIIEKAGVILGGVILGTITIGGLLSYLGMVLVGIPAWLLLRYTGNESGLAYSLLGVVGGWLVGPILGGHKWEGFPLDAAGAVGGGLALFFFWCIARRR